MQSRQSTFSASLLCIGLFTTAALGTTQAAEPRDEPTPNEPAKKQQSSKSPAASAKPKAGQPATLRSKERRKREADIFKPTEQISEDFAAPLPVDI
ncbi:MAG: hypothetical protein CMQ44_09970 [Gammaproteobacteria bacterium]|nr:hypothetical protein [Gammaproteobacteria bacterium]|tara:strand:- start:146 stop:433 length:288 start_codon:yes stop_codon:yes gene_type:complete